MTQCDGGDLSSILYGMCNNPLNSFGLPFKAHWPAKWTDQSDLVLWENARPHHYRSLFSTYLNCWVAFQPIVALSTNEGFSDPFFKANRKGILEVLSQIDHRLSRCWRMFEEMQLYFWPKRSWTQDNRSTTCFLFFELSFFRHDKGSSRLWY